MYKTYAEWEKEQRISPSSPEAYYAGQAWNAAIEEAKKVLSAGVNVEKTQVEYMTLVVAELEELKE